MPSDYYLLRKPDSSFFCFSSANLCLARISLIICLTAESVYSIRECLKVEGGQKCTRETFRVQIERAKCIDFRTRDVTNRDAGNRPTVECLGMLRIILDHARRNGNRTFPFMLFQEARC